MNSILRYTKINVAYKCFIILMEIFNICYLQLKNFLKIT